MNNPQKSIKAKHNKVFINLPAQKVWKELEEYGVESSQKESPTTDCKKPKKVERLLDQAFELLLEKLIRQS